MPALAVAALALALPAAAAPGAGASVRDLLGRSVERRPIGVTVVGDPAAPRSVLVVGSVHGDEPAGRGIVSALAIAQPPVGTRLLLVRNLNPDGYARGTRANARGVDLNRNSSQGWAGAGARPWSEPETRALRALVLRERPALTIYYHQPFGVVDVPETGSARAAQTYARIVGMRVRPLGPRPGSLSRWQNVRIHAGSAFVVELARGRLSRDALLRHELAVLALAAG